MGALIDQVDEYYVRIRFDNALATAKTPIDITRIDKLFELEIVDPAQQKSVTVTNTDLQGATGDHHPLQIRPARQLPNLVRSAGS